MSFHVVQPPGTQQQLETIGKELYEASKRLGMDIELEGFLLAWVNGMRVVVERVDGQIISMALVQTGKQWVRNKVSASIMELRTPGEEHRDAMVEFIKQIAIALGAVSLYMDMLPVQEHPDKNIFTVVEHKLD